MMHLLPQLFGEVAHFGLFCDGRATQRVRQPQSHPQRYLQNTHNVQHRNLNCDIPRAPSLKTMWNVQDFQ